MRPAVELTPAAGGTPLEVLAVIVDEPGTAGGEGVDEPPRPGRALQRDSLMMEAARETGRKGRAEVMESWERLIGNKVGEERSGE
jgi:hypothetical protein